MKGTGLKTKWILLNPEIQTLETINKMLNLIYINDKEFKQISELIYKQSGIKLSQQKKHLVVGRLQKNLKRYGFKNFSDYYDFIINETNGHELSSLINCISTNHTFFYREEKHFKYLEKMVLPQIKNEMKKNNSNDLRIWSAGCSSGEEAYMISIMLNEFFGKEMNLISTGVLGTDISQVVLETAKRGIYPDVKVANLPDAYKNKYFSKSKDDHYSVNSQVKNEVTFRRFNLMNETFPFKKPFQIIFCRNVMIYFDEITRIELIKKFHKFLVPGGYLFIGHSETIGREQKLFEYIQPAVYRRNFDN
jgi:chemotaxis protein methyltransferase CheR